MQPARVFKKEYLSMQELERQINQDQSGFNGLKLRQWTLVRRLAWWQPRCRITNFWILNKKEEKYVSCHWWKERENWLVVLGSLRSNVSERRTSTGSGLFSFFDGGFAQIFSQIASITVKKLRNTNFISSRHVKRENTSLPVDVRRSKTSLLKLPIVVSRDTSRKNFNLGHWL